MRIKTKEVDIIIGPIVMTPQRFQQMDFPYAFIISQLSLIIPMPGRTLNGISAVWKPFQTEV